MAKNLNSNDIKNEKKVENLIAEQRPTATAQSEDRPTAETTTKKKMATWKKAVVCVAAVAVVAATALGIGFGVKNCAQKPPEEDPGIEGPENPGPENPGPVEPGPENPGPVEPGPENPGGNEVGSDLTDDEKDVVASKLLSIRPNATIDETTVKVEATIVENGNAVAYVSALEDGQKVLYRMVYDCAEEKDIPTAEVKNKFGNAKDVEQYKHVNAYVGDEKVSAVNTFVLGQSGKAVNDTYVIATVSNRAGETKATIKYVGLGEEVVSGKVEKQGQEYNVGAAELVDNVMCGDVVVELAGAKYILTKENEMTR